MGRVDVEVVVEVECDEVVDDNLELLDVTGDVTEDEVELMDDVDVTATVLLVVA